MERLSRSAIVVRALDAGLWVAATGVLVLLLGTACDYGRGEEPTAEVKGEVKTPDQEEEDSDPDVVDFGVIDQDDGSSASVDSEVTSGPQTLGGAWSTALELNNGGTHASTTISESVCLTATTNFVSVLESMQFHVDKFCATAPGAFSIAVDSTITVNGVESDKSFHWTASGSCASPTITTSGPPVFNASIPNLRFGLSYQQFETDAIAVDPDDEIRVDYEATVIATLDPTTEFSQLEISGTHSHSFDVGDKHSCNASECTSDADCGAKICEHHQCVDFTLDGKVTSFTVATFPDLDVTVNFAGDTAQLRSLELRGPTAVFQHHQVTTPNQGVAIVTANGLQELVAATIDGNVNYADLNNNAVLGPEDVKLLYGVQGQDFVVTVDVGSNGGDGSAAIRTFPAGSLRLQYLPGVIDIAQTGTSTLTVHVITVDPDSTDGADNGTGRPPLERTYVLKLEDGAVTEVAGDRDGDGVPDDQDGCPDDPNKTAPGLCGCGYVDDEHLSLCTTGLPGRCSLGTLFCSFGAAPECQPNNQPIAETCNGKDDDCDDAVDDELDQNLPCDTGEKGICADGLASCQGAAGYKCDRITDPLPEIPCNSADDDCNGTVDDGGCNDSAADSLKGTCGFDLKKPDNDKADVTVGFSSAGHDFDAATDGMELTIDDKIQVTATRFPRASRAAATGWTTKISKNGNRKWTFKDAKDFSLAGPGKDSATVSCNAKKQLCTAKIAIKGVDLPPFGAGETTVTLTIGDDRVTDTRVWELKSKGKKLAATKDD